MLLGMGTAIQRCDSAARALRTLQPKGAAEGLRAQPQPPVAGPWQRRLRGGGTAEATAAAARDGAAPQGGSRDGCHLGRPE